jgi:AcrR family transcriptional regulator
MSLDKKEHIINVAIELFAEKGFEGTSIRELATKADVNIAMVNYYFGSKDKLFEAMIEHKASYMRVRLEEIVSDKNKSDIEKIDAVIETYVNRILSQYNYHRLIHQEIMLQQREFVHTNIIKLFSINLRIIKSIIEDGIEKKIFKNVDPELTVASLTGTVNQVMLSKSMCCMLLCTEENLNSCTEENLNPYTDENFQNRLINHLKQLMRSHLLNY